MAEEERGHAKNKWQHCCLWAKSNPMLSIAFGFLLLVLFVATPIGIWTRQFCSWAEYGEFLKPFGLFLGPFGAALALHYSGKRTDQMKRQTDAQLLANNHELFTGALGFLASEEHPLRQAGLFTLRNEIFGLNDSYFQPAFASLVSFINTHGVLEECLKSKLKELKDKEMSSSEKENLKELVRIDKFRINLLQEAFNTMLFLETQHSSESDSDQKSEKKFHKLILPGLRFTTDHDFENMWFDDCLLNEMEIYDCRLKNVKFENSKLKDAIFQHVRFENCKMSRCEINGTDFEFQSPKELGNLLVGNKYRPNDPQKFRPELG